MPKEAPAIHRGPKGNPYPGLRPFTSDESFVFFGRDEMRNQLLDRLSASRFLAVIGESGCGKSSLIRAGVLPDLKVGFMPEAKDKWRVAAMKPGTRPFKNLARAMKKEDAFGPVDSIEPNILRCGMPEFLSLMESSSPDSNTLLLPDDTNLLILVDQFEEIFRYADIGDASEAEAFVSLLLDLAEQQVHAIYIIITMRTDFLGDCARFHGLPEAINQGQFLVPRLSEFQLYQSITEPARIFNCEVEEQLVNRFMADVGNIPDYLPLVQHALMRLYDKRKGNILTLEAYERNGGIERVLSNHADEAFKRLSPGQQQYAEVLFRCMSTREKSHRRDTRNPMRFSEIVEACIQLPLHNERHLETGNENVAKKAVRPLIEVVQALRVAFKDAVDAYRQIPGYKINKSAEHETKVQKELSQIIDLFRSQSYNFITPTLPKKIRLDTVIDISHESLIRNWTKMCGDPEKKGREKDGWVKLEAGKRKIYGILSDAAQLWAEGGKMWGDLAKQSQLNLAEKWEEENPTLVWAIQNDTILARREEAGIRKLYVASLTSSDDDQASIRYREKLEQWCRERFDQTLVWLKRSRWKAVVKQSAFVVLPLFFTLALAAVISWAVVYDKEKKMFEHRDRAHSSETAEQAIKHYENAVRYGDTSYQTCRGRAELHLTIYRGLQRDSKNRKRAKENRDQAIGLYEDYMSKHNSVEAMFDLAKVNYEIGKDMDVAFPEKNRWFEKADKLYGRCLEDIRPDNPKLKKRAIDGKLELAAHYTDHGEYSRAIAIHEGVLEIERGNPRALLGKGIALFRQEVARHRKNVTPAKDANLNFSEAKIALNQALKENNAQHQTNGGQEVYVNAKLALGDICLNEKKFKEAEDHFFQILEYKKSKKIADTFKADLGLFSIYSKDQKWILAKEQLDKIVSKQIDQSKPSNQVRIYIASLYLNNKDYPMAIIQYKKLLEANAALNRLDALLGLGASYHGLGDYVEAIQYYEMAVKVKNCPEDISLRLGASYLANRRYKDAEAAYGRFIGLSPGASDDYRFSGDVEPLVRKQQDVSQNGFDKLAYGWIGMGYTQRELGKYDEMDASFKEAEQRDPNGIALGAFNKRNHTIFGKNQLNIREQY